MQIAPILNGVFMDKAPILFEAGDHLDIKYSIQREGKLPFNLSNTLHADQDNVNLTNHY